LSPITWACLGLTYKAFYGIHWSLHGKVGLEEENEQSNSCLAFFLQSWIAPLVLSGHAGIPKFMPVEAVTEEGISEGGTSRYCGIFGASQGS
jgi:hypothetical protein